MPSTYAHRRFGAQAAARLPEELRGVVSRHRALYDIGLHGPDILFYYHALRSNPIKRTGRCYARPARFGLFCGCPRAAAGGKKIRKRRWRICWGLSAILRWTAPAIPMWKNTPGRGYDPLRESRQSLINQLMREDGLDPLRFFTAGHIRPTEENARIIAPFYNGLTTAQVEDALRGMVTIHRCLQASNPAKRWLVLTVMRLAGKRRSARPGGKSAAQPGLRRAAGRQLEQLYTQALPLAVRLMTEYAADEPLAPGLSAHIW